MPGLTSSALLVFEQNILQHLASTSHCPIGMEHRLGKTLVLELYTIALFDLIRFGLILMKLDITSVNAHKFNQKPE
jgi:hypothetical protein